MYISIDDVIWQYFAKTINSFLSSVLHVFLKNCGWKLKL